MCAEAPQTLSAPSDSSSLNVDHYLMIKSLVTWLGRRLPEKITAVVAVEDFHFLAVSHGPKS